MTHWIEHPKIPKNYDRDPNHQYLHKVNPQELGDFQDGKRQTVTAVCTKVWAPTYSSTALLFKGKPLCPYCFPTRSNRAIVA